MSVDGAERLRKFITALVDKDTHLVRFDSLRNFHSFLHANGLKLSWKQKYGPSGGYQLYYHGGAFRGGSSGVVIRVKTHGEEAGKHRAFKPHMSIVFQVGISDFSDGDERTQGKTDFEEHEKGKFSSEGVLESKSPIGSNEEKLSWANRTHFMFPGFQDSNEAKPRGLEGAESLPIDGGSA